MRYETIDIKTVEHDKIEYGKLSFFEAERDIPFDIKRVYFIYETNEGIDRGEHAHKLNHQVLFCPFGKIEIILNDGKCEETVLLDSPSKGLVLYPGLWRRMHWVSKDSVLCVAASEYYNPEEYIRDYEEFLNYVGGK